MKKATTKINKWCWPICTSLTFWPNLISVPSSTSGQLTVVTQGSNVWECFWPYMCAVIPPVCLFVCIQYNFIIHYICSSSQFLKGDIRHHIQDRTCWPTPMTIQGVGVNRNILVCKSNKRLCDTAVTGQLDNGAQDKTNQAYAHYGLTMVYCSFCPRRSRNKWPQAFRCSKPAFLVTWTFTFCSFITPCVAA